MENGILTKYSASAGSGKTTELTRKYLTRLFRSKSSYRKILAVTFTNKAASEMKTRILDELSLLASGKSSADKTGLTFRQAMSPQAIESEAKTILENILHDYSNFSVGTIDSFFQKVLKAFTREIGLQTGYSIELDHSSILAEAVDNLLTNLSNDRLLLNWVSEFAETRIGEGKSWKMNTEIISLAEELFREKYKLLKPAEKEKLRDRDFLSGYVKELKSVKKGFFDHLHLSAENIRQKIDEYSITDEMFFQGTRGIPLFIRRISSRMIDHSEPLNSYIIKVLDDPPRWFAGKAPAEQLSLALKNGLDQEIIHAVRYYTDNFFNANTADAILSNIYTLGIFSDILEEVHTITTDENKFLLSEAGELLYRIIGNDQTPFIYEKIGNRYENYMIDEFQDTSAIQWLNFKPLIDNSMSEGFDNLVVGDVKQSIYRWRNSDWKIFDKIIHQQFPAGRLEVKKLDTNYRSRDNIVAFNNSVFTVVPEILDRLNDNSNTSLKSLFEDAAQNSGGKKPGGSVSFEFVEETEEENFREAVLKKLPGLIEQLQDKGYKGSDIGILVRGNREGSEILKYILDYRNSVDEEKKRRYNYEIISNESLILDQHPVICFIISLLTWLNCSDDDISKALVFRNYLLSTGKDMQDNGTMLTDLSNEKMDKIFPEGYRVLFDEIRHLSLFEAVEKIIGFFSLGEFPGNPAYLNSFQDCVLEFSASNSSEIPAFLEWWSGTGSKRSVILSEGQDSIRVMTIHKSKGLQFRVVIIPFLNWQLNHDKNPTIWTTPAAEPFNKLALVPVKYRKSLINSHFAEAYAEEKISSVVDNLNLIYVAFTRAVDCLFGFCPEKAANRSAAAGSVLKEAIQTHSSMPSDKPYVDLPEFFDSTKNIFTLGTIPEKISQDTKEILNEINVAGYKVTDSLNRLKLRFHGEDFLVSLPEEQAVKLNYGRIMHEVFSLISTAGDVGNAVKKMVLEGKIPEEDEDELVGKISGVISGPRVKEWFESGLTIIKENDILLPSGTTRRPDRIILKENETIVIDFKFGAGKQAYVNQVNSYRLLLQKMGYKNVRAFLWYVDNNQVTEV
jgi:ATP-dependent helicase/nuclease subunit A